MARSKQTTKPVAKSPTTEKKQKVEKSGKPAVKKASINVAEKLAASEAEVANAVAKLVVDDKKAPAPETVSPYQLDKAQTLKAARALLKHVATAALNPAKPNLLEDVSNPEDTAVPIWLVLTTKKYISDTKKLKPTSVRVPYPLTNPASTTLCLIVKDPQRHFKDLVATAGLSSVVTRVIGVGKLRKKFKTYESRRQLFDSHDMFIADDRIVTMLPVTLGSTFYKKTAKIPVPVAIAAGANSADALKNTVSKILASTFVHLAPSASTSIRVALSSFTPEQVVENVAAVVAAMADTKIPGGFKNIKTIHIKSPNSASLPIYMAGEVYGDEDVLKPEEAQEKAAYVAKQSADRVARKEAKSAKRKGLSETAPVEDEATVVKEEKEEAPKAAKKAKVVAEEK